MQQPLHMNHCVTCCMYGTFSSLSAPCTSKSLWPFRPCCQRYLEWIPSEAAPWQIVAFEQEREKETLLPAVLDVCVTREDHRDQEDHDDHRTHHQEQLQMQPNTGNHYILIECIICIINIMRIIVI